jgi:hypothetical protein
MMSRGFSLMLNAPTLVVPVLLITQGLAPCVFCNKQDERATQETGSKKLQWYLIAE